MWTCTVCARSSIYVRSTVFSKKYIIRGRKLVAASMVNKLVYVCLLFTLSYVYLRFVGIRIRVNNYFAFYLIATEIEFCLQQGSCFERSV